MSKKIRIFKIILIVLNVLSVIVLLLVALFFINYDFKEFVLASFVEEETVYARGYSDKAWKEVKINDNINRVIQLLGEPLKKHRCDDGSISYFYSDQGPKNKSCRVRIIMINKDGRVIEKVREFYVD